jgi:tight adherence protein B
VSSTGLLAGATVLLTAAVAAAAHARARRAGSRRQFRSTNRRAPAPRRRQLWWAGLAGAPVVAAFLAGPGLAVVAGAGWVLAPIVARHLRRQRETDSYDAAVPATLEAIARSLRTGVTLGQALEEVAADGPMPLRDDLTGVIAGARLSGGLVPALEAWGTRHPTGSVRLAMAALCLGAETGGAQARAVDGVAATLRQRQAPVAFCAMASTTDSRVGAFLFRSPAGLLVLVIGLGLDAIGAWWMARLTRLPA